MASQNVIKGGDRILDRRDYSKWFFGLSAVLALSYFWSVYDEFVTRRTYIEFQREFRDYEGAVVDKDYQAAMAEFEKNGGDAKVAELNAAIQKLEHDLQSEEYRNAEEAARKAQADYNYWNEQFKANKAVQDNVFYKWKSALHEEHGESGDAAEGGAAEEGEAGAVADNEKHYYELSDRLKELASQRDEAEATLNEANAKVDALNKPLKDKRDELTALTEKKDALADRLHTIKKRDIREIKQFRNDRLGIGGAYTFGMVDRCQSCHVNIDRPGWEHGSDNATALDEPMRKVFETHPRLRMIQNTHGFDKVGCTSCHQGDGRATRVLGGGKNIFVDGKDKPHGLDHYWEFPLLAAAEDKGSHGKVKLNPTWREASCHKCHRDQRWLTWGYEINDETGRLVAEKAAPNYEKGKDLFISKGCHGCHLVKGFGNLPKVGPRLWRVRHKVRPEWLVAWIEKPEAFRPDTRMPTFTLDAAARTLPPEKQHEAALELAAYIWQQGVEENPKPFGRYPGGGDPNRGKTIVKTVGCLACHTIEDGGKRIGNLDASRLEDVGAKVASPDWIYNWIQEPTWHSESTRMPDLRLTTEEARHVTAFLWQSSKDAPPVNDELRHQLEDPELAKKGKAHIPKVGCPACHEIKGQEGFQRIGPELTAFAEKLPYLLAFGDSGIKESWSSWTHGKLHDPRQFLDERSTARMPNFRLADEDIDALVVFLQSLKMPRVPDDMQKSFAGTNGAIERGRAIVNHYNCIGCHQIEGRGGDILATYVDQLPEDEQGALSPPNLKGEGVKIQSAFLNGFFRGPTPIRPWLKIRMPSFNLSDDQWSDVIAYFRGLEGIDRPYDEINLTGADSASIARGAELFTQYQCRNCHMWQGHLPPGELGPRNGPDLAKLSRRARPEGVALWLKNPQQMMPGTAMPGFFFFEDGGELKALRPTSEQEVNDIVNFLFAGPQVPRG